MTGRQNKLLYDNKYILKEKRHSLKDRVNILLVPLGRNGLTIFNNPSSYFLRGHLKSNIRVIQFSFFFCRVYRKRVGMEVKFVGDESHVFCYGERGQKSESRPSILFVHGFTASKDQWLGAFKVHSSAETESLVDIVLSFSQKKLAFCLQTFKLKTFL